MSKKSMQKILLVLTGNVLNTALGFALLAVIARNLSLEEFGKYALLSTLLVGMSKLIDFGTNSVFVAKSIKSTKENFKNEFYTTKILLLAISIPVSIILLTFLNLLSLPLVLIFVGGLIAYAINYTLYALFQKNEEYSKIVFTNTLPALIKGLFAVLFFTNIVETTLIGAFCAFSLSIVASGLLLAFLPKKQLLFNFEPQKALQIIRTSFPAGFSMLIYESWPTLTNSLSKIPGNFEGVGIFSLANKIARIFAIISLSLFTVLLPKNANQKRKHQKLDFLEMSIMSLGILLMAGFATIIARIIIVPIFGSNFAESIGLLDLLIFAAAFTAIHNFMEHYFFVEEKTNYIMNIYLIKLVVFLAIAISLVSKQGLYGIALADLGASAISCILTFVYVKKIRRETQASILKKLSH